MLSSTTLGESPTHRIEEVPASRIVCLCKRPRVLLHFLNEIRGVTLRAPLLHCSKKKKNIHEYEQKGSHNEVFVSNTYDENSNVDNITLFLL